MRPAIVFLDFDGVVTHDRGPKGNPETGELSAPDAGGIFLPDPVCVERLNAICETGVAEVVVSSAWRVGRTVGELQTILERAGFRGEVVGVTDELRSDHVDGRALTDDAPRIREIRRWLADHSSARDRDTLFSSDWEFVVLDDEPMRIFGRRMVTVADGFICGGLQPAHVEAAINALRR